MEMRSDGSIASSAERPATPAAYHAAYVRRLSPLRDVYSKERATEVCLATLTELGFDLANDKNIRTDLEDARRRLHGRA